MKTGMKTEMKSGTTGVMAMGVAVLALAAGAAGAGVESQSIAIDYDFNSGAFGTDVSFQQFDTQGGTRVLEGVTVRFEGTLGLEVTAQSYFDQFIASGSWSADVFHNTILSFNSTEGGDGPSAPFYGLGGIGIANFTGDLTPGIPGPSPFDPGTPGDPVMASYSDSINSMVQTSAGFFDYYTGTGTVEGFFGPFTDIVFTDQPAGFVEVFASELTQQGTLSIDYAFSVVPAPAGMGVLAMGGLVAARRRR